MIKTKEKTKEAYKVLQSEFGYKNVMQAPKIEKAIISVGVGSFKDKKKIDLVVDRLARITGQQPVKNPAKISIAAFKSRTGDIVGTQVTLRGHRMYDFLDRLLNIALPRTKDFRGLSTSGIDEMGNYSLGIREHTIFPETGDEELKDVFGLSITLVTNVKSSKETKAFLTYLGFPFKKIDTKDIISVAPKAKVVKKKKK